MDTTDGAGNGDYCLAREMELQLLQTVEQRMQGAMDMGKSGDKGRGTSLQSCRWHWTRLGDEWDVQQ
jgi:hypothetical protein